MRSSLRWSRFFGVFVGFVLNSSIALGQVYPEVEARGGGTPAVGVIQAKFSQPLTPVQVSKAALSAPGPSSAQLAASQAQMARRNAWWAARTAPAPSGSPPASTSSSIPVGRQTGFTGLSPAVPGTFRIFRNSVASTASPTGFAANVNEPAVAAAGANVLMTWNWRAALSVDGGITWDDINPYADFPTFCCDQDALYDRGRNMILWERLGTDAINLSRSTNGGATWCAYTLTPATFGFSSSESFDSPHLATTNDFVYITTDMFTFLGEFARMLLMRLPLDALRTCSSVSIPFWTRTVGWSWEPVQGARQVMYLGDTTDPAGIFTVFTQPEANTTLSFVNKIITPWIFTNRDGTCTVLGGTNPCARADQRITAGVVTNNTAGGALTNGVITFFWNVKEGGSFPFPYVEAASFAESTKAYSARPLIWNTSYAWQWVAASPNERGDIGITVYRFQSTLRPLVYAGIDDDFNGNPPNWELVRISSSTGNPSENSWGDYSRVRPYFPGGTAWAASVYTKNASKVSEPRFAIFGRERDTANVTRWWAR